MMEDNNDETIPHEDIEEDQEDDGVGDQSKEDEDDVVEEIHKNSYHQLNFEQLCHQLRHNTITEYCDDFFEIKDDECAFQLAALLTGNTTLKSANFTLCRPVTKAGVEALARGLNQSKIESLLVEDDNVARSRTEYETDVLFCFCEAAMKKLVRLELPWQMNDETVTRFSRALRHDSCTLEELDLNCFSVHDPAKIYTLLESIWNSNIRKLFLVGGLSFCRYMLVLGILSMPKLHDITITTHCDYPRMQTVQDWKLFGEMTSQDDETCPFFLPYLSTALSVKVELYDYLGNHEVPLLAKVIGRNPNLKMLDLESNTIGDEGVACLIERWDKWQQLETLDLVNNKVGVVGLCQLLNAASTHPSLKSLDLSWNVHVGREGFQSISQELINGFQLPSQLRELNLTGCDLTDGDLVVLAKGLQCNQNLKKLRLDNNNIGDQGVALLVESLENGFALEELHLSSNASISAVSVRNLVKLTCIHPCLKALYLDHCGRIPYQDLFLIAQELKKSKLSTLIVRVEGVRFVNMKSRKAKAQRKACDVASDALVNAIKCNMHLEEFSLDLIEIPRRSKQAIKFFLDTAKSIRQLLKLNNEPPSGLWCNVLAKYDNNYSLVFYLLGEKPLLVPASERMATKKRERSESTEIDATF